MKAKVKKDKIVISLDMEEAMKLVREIKEIMDQRIGHNSILDKVGVAISLQFFSHLFEEAKRKLAEG